MEKVIRIISGVDLIFKGGSGRYVVSGDYHRGNSWFFVCLVVCRERASAGTVFFTLFKFRKRIRALEQAVYAAQTGHASE